MSENKYPSNPGGDYATCDACGARFQDGEVPEVKAAWIEAFL